MGLMAAAGGRLDGFPAPRFQGRVCRWVGCGAAWLGICTVPEGFFPCWLGRISAGQVKMRDGADVAPGGERISLGSGPQRVGQPSAVSGKDSGAGMRVLAAGERRVSSWVGAFSQSPTFPRSSPAARPARPAAAQLPQQHQARVLDDAVVPPPVMLRPRDHPVAFT